MNNKVPTILYSLYLPPIDYFKVIKRVENWRLESCENYVKQSFRNRAYIYGSLGKLSITVPVSRKGGSSAPILKTQIDNSTNWQVLHWRAILSAYNSSPFFEYYRDEFYPFYFTPQENLFNFNLGLLKLILELIGLNPDVVLTSEFTYPNEGDIREMIHPKRESPFIEEYKEKRGHYHQLFAPKLGFIPNLSIIDLLFNEGPNSISYL